MDLQRRLSLHPNVVRFMGACCHIPSTGRPFQDDTLDNWQVRTHHAKPMPANTPAPAVSLEVMYTGHKAYSYPWLEPWLPDQGGHAAYNSFQHSL